MDSIELARRMIRQSGLTQREVCAAMGKSPAYISAALSRGSDLQSGTLAMIADACGCDVRVIRRDTGEDVGRVAPRG